MSEKRMADKAMEEKNILIFPAGSEIGLEIFNALKYQKYLQVFGGTSGEDHTQYLYKNIIRLPYISDEDFIDKLNEQIEKYNIDYIFPAYDFVQCCLMEHAQKIHACIISAKREVVSICRNKQKTYEFLGDVWYRPKFYNDINSVATYPVFIKPKEGQGSEGVHKVMNEKELVYYLQNDNTYVICEYLGGKEYTVDCFTDEMGTLRISKTRIRNKIKNGISVAAEIVEDDSEFVRIAEDLNSRFDFRGAWFFQVKRNEAGCLKLLEVSPRISGTMGLSRNMGINFPMLSLYLHMGIHVEIVDNDYSIAVDRSLISRYKIDIEYDTAYVDFDDTLIIKGKVNVKLLAFLYQLKNNAKKIVLLTKHVGDIYEELEKYYIDKRIFNEIILMDKTQNKADYIDNNNSIFIDDSFMERKKVYIAKQIPVFDLDSVEALIDWRM